ncbi:MAG: c-type cytochrome [Cytophagales bacterium]|nr:c-type cytochrome [Cytophagales bacterium]
MPNCLSCHASYLENKLIIGLGNTLLDFSSDQSINLQFLNKLILSRHDSSSLAYKDFKIYKQALEVIAPLSKTNTQGVNPADKYALILASHRNNESLEWQSKASVDIDKSVIPTDVPAWWLLKKKNAMFYTGVGRGDFSRLMMASSLLSLNDSSDAHQIDSEFANMYAFIMSIDPPKYSKTIDQTAAKNGKIIFEKNCQQCHGTYGNNPTYPNLLIPLETIKTDPELIKANFSNSSMVDWYNKSWFARPPFASQLVVQKGYIAPPLDGIWATAPYLHNGSVPTLEDLLNSSQRPPIWKRNFNIEEYDARKVGWKYHTPASKTDTQTYDTSQKGYGNQGHYFGDGLSLSQRSDLIEYLKSL